MASIPGAVAVGWCGDVSIRLHFQAGWCDLTFQSGTSSYVGRTTFIIDGFTDFVDSVADLAEGRRSTAVVWGKEPGGVFIDTSRTFANVLCIVVAELRNDDWLAPSNWLPERGSTLWTATVSRDDFLLATYRALMNLTVISSTAVEGWQWPFPAIAFHRLQAAVEESINVPAANTT